MYLLSTAHLSTARRPGCYKRMLMLTSMALVALLFALPASNVYAEPLEVIIATPENLPATDIRHYYKQLLQLALQKTQATDGDFIISHNTSNSGPERERAMLMAEAGLTVTWGTVTPERQAQLRTVPVDLVKNLNSYRALIIHPNQQARFAHIQHLNELRELSAGSGINWSINGILGDNGFRLVTSGSFSGLYKMLAAGRIDFVLRTPYEVDGELAEFKQYPLKLEERLLLKLSQPQPYSFFVNKHNGQLAKRLEHGLQLAQADGSFDALFANYPCLTRGQQLVNDASRLTLTLASAPAEKNSLADKPPAPIH